MNDGELSCAVIKPNIKLYDVSGRIRLPRNTFLKRLSKYECFFF